MHADEQMVEVFRDMVDLMADLAPADRKRVGDLVSTFAAGFFLRGDLTAEGVLSAVDRLVRCSEDLLPPAERERLEAMQRLRVGVDEDPLAGFREFVDGILGDGETASDGEP